jgi:iron complex transport system substrate-binding protein
VIHRRTRTALVAAALALAAVPAAASAAYPVTVKADNGQVTVPATPKRIVSLSPTATEMLFAVGAGSQVVAVDDQSNYPAGVPRTSLSGFTPNVEAIAKYHPDLVVISNDQNRILGKLRTLGITVLLDGAPKNITGTYRQIGQLGIATGHRPGAGRLIGRMKRRLGAIFAAAPRSRHLRVFHELGPELFTATSRTFIGTIYTRLGLVNIADGAPGVIDYPQLSSEALIAKNPQLIVLADVRCCGVTRQQVAARTGWGNIAAVKNGDVFGVNDDIASRWGPRIVNFAQTLLNHAKAAG